MNIVFKGKKIKKQIKKIRNISSFGLEETAGIIFGYFKDGICFITHLINKTIESSFSDVSFAYDGNPNLDVKFFRWKYKIKTRYIGTWHTHPSFDVKPSTTDKETMDKIVDKLALSINPFLIFNEKHVCLMLYKNGEFRRKEVLYEDIKYED